MAIESYKLKDGTLRFDTGTPFDVSMQVTACKITPSENVQTVEAKKVLGGDELAAQDSASYTYRLSGSMIQSLDADGVVLWSWTNEGVEVPFTFIPNDVAARQWTGIVRVIPLTVGGDDIEGVPESEFDWACIGKPVPAAVV